ncbi:protein glass-like isoform X6 [Haliotis rufescens]|uniref:protein glass-like isoform X6 n=1 Tax=Haliotis rufescens TaxID=6454 RepID=UPI00201F8B6C|nr:protein glass-like isoform X6 [Haliotis rufescens]
MFIETLEFTIPIDLCSLCATLQKGCSDMEFPASVNSYGTTQDANIQVLLKSNKLTFKVDGVSSGASIISKNECKTLKLSVFDVDRSLMPQEDTNFDQNSSNVHHPLPTINHGKRTREQSVTMPAKASRNSFYDSPTMTKHKSPTTRRGSNSHQSSSSSSSSSNNTRLPCNATVKTEPEEPDLIEIEPDPHPAESVKKEVPYMQIDFSSDVPHTQTSQAALDRLSHPQPSISHSPGSSSSSYQQNVPHVPDYTEPSTSQARYGDQSADDFLVFQDENDEVDDNEVDFSNDDYPTTEYSERQANSFLDSCSDQSPLPAMTASNYLHRRGFPSNTKRHSQSSAGRKTKQYACQQCDKVFGDSCGLNYHREAIHDKIKFQCPCGKVYKYRTSLVFHMKSCPASKPV